MHIDAYIKKLKPHTPFRIARGAKLFVENVFIKIEQDGITGYGEASPNSYYGESADTVLTKILGIKGYLTQKNISSIQDIKNIWHEIWPLISPSRAAQCALDIAFWDILGKKKGLSLSQLIWKKPPKSLHSSYTLSICSLSEIKEMISNLKKYPIIKVKMDSRGDLDFLKYVHSSTQARIRVDANCSWEKLDISFMIEELKKLEIEFIEQPLPPEQDYRMEEILKHSTLPIIADESCTIPSSVQSLRDKFNGINIKLVKCGGLTPGIEMLYTAKKLGLQIMVGCMLESNLLISAEAVLGQQADYIDLDGSFLLKDRVFDGVEFESGILTLSGKEGLGVNPL